MTSRNYALKGELRERAGKGIARALRRENKVPGVIYGDGKTPAMISLDGKYVNLEYRKGQMYTSLCNLEIGSEKHLVLARDVQLHPVSDLVEHVDFLRVTPKTKLRVSVPVKFLNEAICPGIKEGGVLNVVLWNVELLCVATEIPDHIEVDLTNSQMGDVIKMSNIKLPAGAAPYQKGRDLTVASVNEPRRVIEEVPVAAAAATAEGAAPAEGAAAEGAEGAAAEGGDKKAADAKAPAAGAKDAKPAGDKGGKK